MIYTISVTVTFCWFEYLEMNNLKNILVGIWRWRIQVPATCHFNDYMYYVALVLVFSVSSDNTNSCRMCFCKERMMWEELWDSCVWSYPTLSMSLRRQGFLLSLFYRRRNWVSERLSNTPKITAGCRAEVQTLVCLWACRGC